MAWLLCLLPSSGCALLGSRGQRIAVVHQKPEVVAWALAEACREAMPSADSMPAHGHPQILRTGSSSYRLHFSRSNGGPYRTATNGRISPAHLVLSGAFLDYLPGTFQPSPSESACANAGIGLLIRIDPHKAGSRVEITWQGDSNLRLADSGQLEDALLLLNACSTSRELAAAGDWQRLRTLFGEIESRLHASPASHASKLVAPLLWYRALAHRRLGSLIAAHADLTRCLDLDHSLVSVRARLLHLDDRLSKSSEALRSLHTMVNDGSLGIASTLLASRFNRLRSEAGSMDEASRSKLAAKVALAIDAGDLPAARSWLDLCISKDPSSDHLWYLRVRLLRAESEFRSSFSAGLAMSIMAGKADPRTLLATCLDSLELGDPSLGLRLLARNWAELHRRQPIGAERTLQQLLAVMDPKLAVQILAMERSPGLANPEFLRLLGDAGLGADSTMVIRQLDRLRRRSTDQRLKPIQIESQPGFESAPGVAPVR